MKRAVFKPIACCNQLNTDRLFKIVTGGHCLYCGTPLSYETVEVTESGNPLAVEEVPAHNLVSVFSN